MTIKSSTGLRDILLGTGSLKATFDAGSEIRIYAGTVPADADASIGAATLLVTIKNGVSGITFEAAPSGGILEKNAAETWSGVNAATGTPTFYRHVLTADTGALSTTAPRYQGTVAVAGADMNLTSSTLTSGATQTLDSHAVALPI
ncbi:hypothetical protein C7T35_01430 [Variovorax sp. WS11]|uniref:hypothetical protein n=1 Tax=Variovorax sp. WS11 TaxID=1105204 RepID=UPI000D0CF9C4|nr:hypothetical protein [Variovorax sp. WS11]NDZ11486.1 hypothetical protein [Variovorax sp. WS11]PSL86656.1 hypothetical protein C7T35_01430 [Variovorax sp. WS11]